jgi:hypothetical protein
MKAVHIAADATLAEFLKTTKYSQSSFPSNICLLLVGEVPKGALARRVSRAETYYETKRSGRYNSESQPASNAITYFVAYPHVKALIKIFPPELSACFASAVSQLPQTS